MNFGEKGPEGPRLEQDQGDQILKKGPDRLIFGTIVEQKDTYDSKELVNQMQEDIDEAFAHINNPQEIVREIIDMVEGNRMLGSKTRSNPDFGKAWKEAGDALSHIEEREEIRYLRQQILFFSNHLKSLQPYLLEGSELEQKLTQGIATLDRMLDDKTQQYEENIRRDSERAAALSDLAEKHRSSQDATVQNPEEFAFSAVIAAHSEKDGIDYTKILPQLKALYDQETADKKEVA